MKKLTQFMTLSVALLLTGVWTASARGGNSPETLEQQQGKTRITGTVVDRTGEPVIGASILEKGVAANGTISDVDGKFSLSVSPGATLAVSFLGYVKQEIAVGSRAVIDVTLQEDAKALDEVVVVGYGVQKKRDLTGAISSVKVAEMPVQVYSTVSHALAGKAAGLQVTQTSAQPGGGATFRIRGATSTGAGNEPLVVIDGFPISWSSKEEWNLYDYNTAGPTDNVLESLNPNDIESIEVLKDASSTAIYGSRAGHGVILVTTKRGRNQKATVTYSGNATVQQVRNNYRMLDAKGYMEFRNKVFYEDYLRVNALDVYAGYVDLSPTHVVKDFTPIFSDREIDNAVTTDWIGEVTRAGVQHSHNISMTGGSESTQYMASANFFDQEGILKNTGTSRFTAKLNLDQRLSRFVKAGLTFNLSRNYYNSMPQDGQNETAGVFPMAAEFNPTLPVYDANGDYTIDPRRPGAANPVSMLEITDNTTKDRLLGSAFVEVAPIKGLMLKASLGADRREAKRKMYVPTTTMRGKLTHGTANISESSALDYLMDLTATYVKEIAQHNFTLLAGYSYQAFNGEGVSAGSKDFILDSFLYNNLGVGAVARPSVGSWANKSALGSYFARVNYSFLGRYLLTATMRADGDSNFNPEYRWGYFPSASLGWRFNDEAFMQPFSSWLSNGKLRVSYGQTGNSNVGNHIMDYYKSGLGYIFGDSFHSSVSADQLGNPKLKWETTTEFNIGLDLGFLNSRINIAAEYYDRVISDLLASKSLLSYHEITSTYANIGKTQGRGVEITLNTVNIQNRDFEWSTDLTYSFYRDRWLERAPDWKPAVYQSATDPIRAAFSTLSDGLLQAGEERPKHQLQLLPGQVKIKDISGPDGEPDRKIDDYDRVYTGSSDPDFLFGINNTLRYKNLDLNIYFYGAVNQYRGYSYYENISTLGENASTLATEVWYHDNQNSAYPSIIASIDGIGNYGGRNVSYIRCRNITLGYILPLSKKIVQRARVYVDVNNPFIITNWTGADPETDGLDRTYQTDSGWQRLLGQTYAYPNATSFTIGLDITF
jgi:TonB-linked SusC/RagA family outer membrane protein